MKRISHILKSKAIQSVYSIAPSATVFDAVTLMSQRNVGALLVMETTDVVGIVSERDCVWRMVPSGRSPNETQVCEIMSAPVQYVPSTHTNEECMALMTDKRLRHLPVIDEGRLVGLISIGDLVKDIISEQNFIIEQLEHYIMGDRG